MTHAAFVGELIAPAAPEWTRPDPLDQPAFVRHPRCIPLLTGTNEEAESALLDVRYKPRRPQWTELPPSHEGWFWVRERGMPSGLPVYVRRESGALIWSTLGFRWRPVHTGGLQWSDREMLEPE